MRAPSSQVVYAASIDSVEAVAYKLGSRNGIEALALHQDMSQSARQQVIAKFRSAAPGRNGQPPKRVLVVYDALSRSLSDVGQVPLLINFDMPRAVEDYVHRYVLTLRARAQQRELETRHVFGS